MRGVSHLSMSLVISFPSFLILYNMSPVVQYTYSIEFILFGILVGSLLPDIDANDSKVMHGWWRPIGVFSKYVFYYPLAKLLRWKSDTFKDEHRGFLHSLIGWVFISLFFGIISVILYLFLWFAWYIWIGISVGFLLHLVEDSFTRSGVRWFFPKEHRIRGTIRTNSGSEYFLGFIFGIAFLSMASIEYYLVPSSILSVLMTILGTAFLLALFHMLNPRINSIGNRWYTLKRIVEFYIEDSGGKKTSSEEPCLSILDVRVNEDSSIRQYISRITGVGGQYGLTREWQNSYIDASDLKEGEIVEVQITEEGRKTRIYYIVQNSKFCPFVKRICRTKRGIDALSFVLI